MADPRVSLNFAPGPQPTITGEDNVVDRRRAGFVVGSSPAAGKVPAVSAFIEPIVFDDPDPLLWDGDQA